MSFYNYIHKEELSKVLKGLLIILKSNDNYNLVKNEINWLEQELNGYKKESNIPKYRILELKTIVKIKNKNGKIEALNVKEIFDKKIDIKLKKLECLLKKESIYSIKDRLCFFEEILKSDNYEIMVGGEPSQLIVETIEEILKEEQDYFADGFYTTINKADVKYLLSEIRNNAIDIYKKKIESTHLQKLAEEIFMSNGNNNQTNIGSIVNNGSNSIISGNTVNYAINNSKEDDFIEELKELISQDKEQPQMVKNLVINELNNIKGIKNEEERINRWNNFRAMVADWTTIMTPLVPFLASLGIS